MRYAIINDGVIVNIIICEDDDVALLMDGIPVDDSYGIGDIFQFPKSESERIGALESENALLKAQLQAQSERSDFIEDCIAEMAMLTYAK